LTHWTSSTAQILPVGLAWTMITTSRQLFGGDPLGWVVIAVSVGQSILDEFRSGILRHYIKWATHIQLPALAAGQPDLPKL
jgi:hypothetical protein